MLQASALALALALSAGRRHGCKRVLAGGGVEQREGCCMCCWVVEPGGAACTYVCGGWQQSVPLQQHRPLVSTLFVPPRPPSRIRSIWLGAACCRAIGVANSTCSATSPRHWRAGAVCKWHRNRLWHFVHLCRQLCRLLVSLCRIVVAGSRRPGWDCLQVSPRVDLRYSCRQSVQDGGGWRQRPGHAGRIDLTVTHAGVLKVPASTLPWGVVPELSLQT